MGLLIISIGNCCLTPNEQLISYIMAMTSYIRWDDDLPHFEPM